MSADPFEGWSPGWREKVDAAQHDTHVFAMLETYARIPYGAGPGEESPHLLDRCRGCNCARGQLHVWDPPCFGETCPVCGGQAFGCECLAFAMWGRP